LFNIHERWGQEQHRPTVVCITAAIAFSIWFSFGDPRYYQKSLSQYFSLTGDLVIDAELYRGVCNALLIVLLVGIIKLCFRQTLVDYGLGIGQWRKAPVLVAATPMMLVFGYIGAVMPEYHEYYPATLGLVGRSLTVFLLHALILVTHYVAWELLFRGFIQTAMMPRLRVSGAIAAQTMASTLAHMDRPTSELFGSIAAGILWGILAYRTKSIWPVVMHHLLLGLTVDYWICFGGSG